MRMYSDEIIIMTDDGSYGNKGLVTQGMEDVIKKTKVDQVIAIGPAIMMKYAALLTGKYNIPTLVSLNSIMVDGTGMCGACRVSVGGEQNLYALTDPSSMPMRLILMNCYQDWVLIKRKKPPHIRII